MARSFPTSFEDADPDPPRSELSEESQLVLATQPEAFAVTVVHAMDKALAGDSTDLNAVRQLFEMATPAYGLPSTPDIVAGVPVFRFYPPNRDPASLSSQPLVIFFHGGAWAYRLVEPTSLFCTELAKALDLEVVSVDYSVSPEAPPETALRECQAVFRALSPGRFTILGGDSAGANMVAGMLYRILEDEPGTPLPDAIFMFYPVLDFTDYDTPSFHRFSKGFGLAEDETRAYIKGYQPDQSQWERPRFSPLFGNPKGFPPTLLLSSQFDVLRDHDLALARKIEAAGTPIRFKCMKGVIHGVSAREGFNQARANIIEEVRQFVDLVKPI
jgi:acetyl esterase